MQIEIAALTLLAINMEYDLCRPVLSSDVYVHVQISRPHAHAHDKDPDMDGTPHADNTDTLCMTHTAEGARCA